MSFIRLLPIPVIATLMVSVLFGYQWLYMTFPVDVSQPGAFWKALWLTNSGEVYPSVVFPILGWGPLMGLGFVLGQYVNRPVLKKSLTWLMIGGGLLLFWFIIRLIGGYGNIVPYEAGQPIVYFFIMSKAPPSLVYLFI